MGGRAHRGARVIAAACAVVVLAVLGSGARAENKDQARAAYQRGSQHYDLGEYQPALDSFKEAYRNFEDPVFLFNIAQCHRQLGDNEQAVREYRMYLVKLPDAADAAGYGIYFLEPKPSDVKEIAATDIKIVHFKRPGSDFYGA